MTRSLLVPFGVRYVSCGSLYVPMPTSWRGASNACNARALQEQARWAQGRLHCPFLTTLWALHWASWREHLKPVQVQQGMSRTHRQQASSNVCHVFFACSQAVSWITWRRFWMTYRTASYRSFSQIAAQARQQARSTSKPSSMTSCSSPVTAALERLWPPRNQQWGFHRAVSPACARAGKACEAPKRGLWCLFLPCQGRRGTKAVSQPFLSLVWWPSAICGRLILKHVWRLRLIHTVRCKLVPFWGDIRKSFKIN